MTYSVGPSGPAPSLPPRPSTAWRVVRLVLALLLGVLVGAIGTVMFQAVFPVGLVLALVATLAGAVTARAWSGFGTLVAYAAGWFAAVQVLAAKGPGGDVLVPGGHASSYVWVYGGFVLVMLSSFAPRSWFADQARPQAASAQPGPQGPQDIGAGPWVPPSHP